MKSKPCLVVRERIARQRQTLADQLVLGLITGGLLGTGLMIEQRGGEQVQFARRGGWLRDGPDRGEIELRLHQASGETELEFRLWCQGMNRRRLVLAAVVGALCATVAAVAFNWLMHWSIPAGALIALLYDLVGRRGDRQRLRDQIKSYLDNTRYLKIM